MQEKKECTWKELKKLAEEMEEHIILEVTVEREAESRSGQYPTGKRSTPYTERKGSACDRCTGSDPKGTGHA